MPREGVATVVVDNSEGASERALPLGAIKRERWLDMMLREAQRTLPTSEYAALLDAIPFRDRQAFVERKVPLGRNARHLLEMLDKKVRAIRQATGLQKEMLLPIVNPEAAPGIAIAPPEIFDDIEPLSAVGD